MSGVNRRRYVTANFTIFEFVMTYGRLQFVPSAEADITAENIVEKYKIRSEATGTGVDRAYMDVETVCTAVVCCANSAS